MGRYAWEKALVASDAPAAAIAAARGLLFYHPDIRPGVDRLAADMRVHPATVRRGMAWLKANGWIEQSRPASCPGYGLATGIPAAWKLAFPPVKGAHNARP